LPIQVLGPRELRNYRKSGMRNMRMNRKLGIALMGLNKIVIK